MNLFPNLHPYSLPNSPSSGEDGDAQWQSPELGVMRYFGQDFFLSGDIVASPAFNELPSFGPEDDFYLNGETPLHDPNNTQTFTASTGYLPQAYTFDPSPPSLLTQPSLPTPDACVDIHIDGVSLKRNDAPYFSGNDHVSAVKFRQVNNEHGSSSSGLDYRTLFPQTATLTATCPLEGPYRTGIGEHNFKLPVSETSQCKEATRASPVDESFSESRNAPCQSNETFSSAVNVPPSDDTCINIHPPADLRAKESSPPATETTPCEESARRKSATSAKNKRKKTAKADRQLVCANCGVTKTPLWRRTPDRKQSLCNACGLYFKQYQCHRPLRVRRCSLQQFARTGSVTELMQTQEQFRGEVDAQMEGRRRLQSIQQGNQELEKRRRYTEHNFRTHPSSRDAAAVNPAFSSMNDTSMIPPQDHAVMQAVTVRRSSTPPSELNDRDDAMIYNKIYVESNMEDARKKRRASSNDSCTDIDAESDSSTCSRFSRPTARSAGSPVSSSSDLKDPTASSFHGMLQVIDKTDAVHMLHIFEERCRYLRSVIAGEMDDK